MEIAANVTSEGHLSVVHVVYLVWSNFLSIAGVASYVAVCCTIIRFRKTTFSNPFYTFVLSLALSDMIVLMLNIHYVTASSILGTGGLPLWYTYISGFLFASASWSILLHIVAIAGNRLAGLLLLQTYQHYFTTRNVWMIISVCYIHAIVATAIAYGCTCVFYTPEGYAWRYTCGTSACAGGIAAYMQIISFITLMGSAALFLAIFIRMRYLGKMTSQSDQTRINQVKKEKALALQFGMIWLVFLMYVIVYWFADSERLNQEIRFFILGTFALLHSAVDPVLYITFSSDIRRLMFKKFTIHPVRAATENATLQSNWQRTVQLMMVSRQLRSSNSH